MTQETVCTGIYYSAKDRTGNKHYYANVFWNGKSRFLKRSLKVPFKRASDAANYGEAVVKRFYRVYA